VLGVVGEVAGDAEVGDLGTSALSREMDTSDGAYPGV